MKKLNITVSIITILSFLIGTLSIVLVFLIKCETDKILNTISSDTEIAKKNTEKIIIEIDNLEIMKTKEITTSEIEEKTLEMNAETSTEYVTEIDFIKEIIRKYEDIENIRINSEMNIKDLEIERLKEIIESYIILEERITKRNIKNPYFIIPSIYYNLALYSYYYAYNLDSVKKHTDAEAWYRYSEKISSKGIGTLYSYPTNYQENPDYSSLLKKLETANNGAKIQLEYWDN